MLRSTLKITTLLENTLARQPRYKINMIQNFSSENKNSEKTFNLNFEAFDPKKSSHIEALNEITNTHIKHSEEEKKANNVSYTKMVEWLKFYVGSDEFIEFNYNDRRSLELVAEATFWSAMLGLEPFLAKMNYAEIRAFQPLAESFRDNNTERSKILSKVCRRLTKPAWSFEASYALSQAAFCIYVRNNSFEKFQEEENLYESRNAMTLKMR